MNNVIKKPRLEIRKKENENILPSHSSLPKIPPSLPPSPNTIPDHNPRIKLPRVQPGDSSLNNESTAQGLPPMKVAPSVEHFHEGHLGEVTHRGGAVTSPNPPFPLHSSFHPNLFPYLV